VRTIARYLERYLGRSKNWPRPWLLLVVTIWVFCVNKSNPLNGGPKLLFLFFFTQNFFSPKLQEMGRVEKFGSGRKILKFKKKCRPDPTFSTRPELFDPIRPFGPDPNFSTRPKLFDPTHFLKFCDLFELFVKVFGGKKNLLQKNNLGPPFKGLPLRRAQTCTINRTGERLPKLGNATCKWRFRPGH